jgi:hypothetical protein
MKLFEQRENAYEAEFVHREELHFRAREIAVNALAIWAAGHLGKTGEAAKAYAKEVVAADVSNPTIEPTIERIAADLAPKGIGKVEIHEMMDRNIAAADAAVRSAPWTPR